MAAIQKRESIFFRGTALERLPMSCFCTWSLTYRDTNNTKWAQCVFKKANVGTREMGQKWIMG